LGWGLRLNPDEEPEEEEPVREAARDAGGGASFAGEQPSSNKEAPVLSPSGPYDAAKEYVRRNCARYEEVDGKQVVGLTLYFHQGRFWKWNECYFEPYSDAVLRAAVYEFLDGARKRTFSLEDGFQTERFRPKPDHVNGLLDGLRSGLTLEAVPPVWLQGSGIDPKDVLPFRNGLLNLKTGGLSPLTPRLFVKSGIDFNYDPKARCPRWERFLTEIFPGDQPSADCLEEMIGYCMTENNRFEKAFLLIGKRRSGKGTIAEVINGLVGSTSFGTASFHTWMRGENSRQNLITKKVIVFGDVRFKPGKWYGMSFEPGGIDHVSAEFLLNITGGDAVSIGQKYKEAWEGRLRAKVILISNDPPNLQDGSGVLRTRFIKINFDVSFADREDNTLKDTLLSELPGIAYRCLGAYRRLLRRGRFIQPESSRVLEREITAKTEPLAAFALERCIVENGAEVKCSTLYTHFRAWCEDNGRLDVFRSIPQNTFRRRLNQLSGFEHIRTFHPHDKPRVYLGISLKTAAERNEE
jgi:putative DNA primase/helicase